MTNQRNSFSVFYLKGFSSIQIGIYFLLASYLIKIILDGFLIDDNPMGMMSSEIIEYVILAITFLLFLFSFFALFFSARRRSKKLNILFWKTGAKNFTLTYFGILILIYAVFYTLKNQGFTDFIIPIFLLFYGFIFFLISKKDFKNQLIISIISLLLATICFLIPSYWYASLTILGIAHITYGIAYK